MGARSLRGMELTPFALWASAVSAGPTSVFSLKKLNLSRKILLFLGSFKKVIYGSICYVLAESGRTNAVVPLLPVVTFQPLEIPCKNT